MLRFIKGLFVAEPEDPAPENLVLFTPNDGSWDVKTVRRLLDAGLSRLHVQARRDWQLRDYEKFVKSLPDGFHPRVVLEDHAELVLARRLGGYQLRAGQRAPRRWPKEGVLAAKCHSYDELRQSDRSCRYVFLAPVFESVSKRDHRPRRTTREFQVIVQRWKAEGGCPAYALGGITPRTAEKARELGFDGVGFIGSVWRDADPVRAFIEIERAWCGREARRLRRSR
jgi:thiamine-phosphate pyrophosphorylase